MFCSTPSLGEGPGWGQRALVQNLLCTCSREHGGAVVFSLWIICPQPREALPEEGGAGEQLPLTLVAVV